MALHPTFAAALAPFISPQTPACPTCAGTGETGAYGILDCMAPDCTAAVERAALNAAVQSLGPMTLDDLVWHVYQVGKQVPIEKFPVHT